MQTVELKTYDWRLARTARPETARQDIVLVEIDEFSLRNLEPYAGRWPWPRVVHSMLLDYLARGPAKVIAYDVNFAEPDDQGSFEFGSATLSGAESDQYLADSIKAAGNVILLADATYEAAEGTSREFPDAGFALDAPASSSGGWCFRRSAGWPPQRRPRTQPVRSGSRRPAPSHGALRAEWGSRAAVARPGGRAESSGDRAPTTFN